MVNIKTNPEAQALSESMETYLITIARLRSDEQPVPLSQLAEVLSISPVSVNEMCRKLQDQGFALYQPYKGVSLTPEGEKRAHYTLRRHRLWEVFLVNKLKFNWVEAHQAACQLEHTTPNLVADRLDAYLEYPATNPEGEPIPRANGMLPKRSWHPLTQLAVGRSCIVIRCDANQAGCDFLDDHGICPGAVLGILAGAPHNLLVQVDAQQISIARTLAELIIVEPQEPEL